MGTRCVSRAVIAAGIGGMHRAAVNRATEDQSSPSGPANELVQRDGGYQGYGAQNAPVRLAAQHAQRPVR